MEHNLYYQQRKGFKVIRHLNTEGKDRLNINSIIELEWLQYMELWTDTTNKKEVDVEEYEGKFYCGWGGCGSKEVLTRKMQGLMDYV